MVTAVLIAFDVFPAKVVLPTGSELDRVRAAVADDELMVWSEGPQVRFARDALAIEGTRASGFMVQVEDGIVTVSRGSWCGCGSGLRKYNPWPGRARKLVSA